MKMDEQRCEKTEPLIEVETSVHVAERQMIKSWSGQACSDK